MIAKLSDDWQDLLGLLPGYDPFAQSEGYWFDAETAELYINFAEAACTHVMGDLAGKNILLEPWQRCILANLFGWKDEKGLRRYREALIYIPRGNAKTTLAAIIVICSMCLDGEKGSEIISAAAERGQARLCFEIVEGMLRNNEELAELATIFKYSISMNDATYKAVSAEAKSKHGGNTHVIVNDELHAHQSGELTKTLMTSQLKRSQPLCVHLTTADVDRPSMCNEKHEYARKVRDDIHKDPAFLPAIYEALPTDDWQLKETWIKANPNWRVMNHEYFEREYKRALVDLSYQNEFKQLHLNMKVSATHQAFDVMAWSSCDQRLTIEEVQQGEVYGALDLSSVSDLSSFVLESVKRSNPIEGSQSQIIATDVFPWFWVPEEAVAKRSRERSLYGTYSAWQQSGDLQVQSGSRINQDEIRQHINQLREDGWNIKQIAYDPWQAEAIRQQLESDGFTMISFAQTIKNFSESFKDLIALCSERKVRHGNHPVLRWNVSNVMAYTDCNGFMRPDKAKSIDKIDGAVAMIMAHGLAIKDEDSVYNYDYYETNEFEMF